jgi:hypothetical protein
MTKPTPTPASLAKPTDDVEAARPIPRVPLAFAIIGGLTIGLGLAGRQFGAPGVVLGLAGATLIACIAAFWASVRTMIGESRISGADAFAIGNTGGAQEQKRAVLRALKDLEFERAVGKISDEDFKVLVARYRAEAKRLLKQIDEASAEQRGRAEELVNRRLEKLGLLPPTPAGAAADPPIVREAPAFEKAAPVDQGEDEDEADDEDEDEDEVAEQDASPKERSDAVRPEVDK